MLLDEAVVLGNEGSECAVRVIVVFAEERRRRDRSDGLCCACGRPRRRGRGRHRSGWRVRASRSPAVLDGACRNAEVRPTRQGETFASIAPSRRPKGACRSCRFRRQAHDVDESVDCRPDEFLSRLSERERARVLTSSPFSRATRQIRKPKNQEAEKKKKNRRGPGTTLSQAEGTLDHGANTLGPCEVLQAGER